MRTESDSLRKSSFNLTAAEVSGHAFATGEGRRSEVSVDALVTSPGRASGHSKPLIYPGQRCVAQASPSFTHVVETQVAVGKNKATTASKATPAIDNWKGRVQRKVLVESGARFRCAVRCAPERGPRWQTHVQRRKLGISVRPGHPAPAATLPALPAAGESATPSRDGSRRWHPTANSARRRGAWSADRDHKSRKNLGAKPAE